MRLTITFSLDTDRDGDLAGWLGGLQSRERSQDIRKVLRIGLGMSSITHDDIYRAIQNLGRKLQSGAIIPISNQDDAPMDEPPDIVATLDKLGL